MKKGWSFISIILLSIPLLACGNKQKDNATQALFKTRSDAEKAAKAFNCTGAHKMGDKWMPCKKHSSHNNSHSHKH